MKNNKFNQDPLKISSHFKSTTNNQAKDDIVMLLPSVSREKNNKILQPTISTANSIRKPQTEATQRQFKQLGNLLQKQNNLEFHEFNLKASRLSIQKMPKLYNPHLLEKFTHKIHMTRAKYETLYQQFHSNDGEKPDIQNLPALVNNTEDIINSTYSIKYFGINNNQIGVLSKRVPLKLFTKESNPRHKGLFFSSPISPNDNQDVQNANSSKDPSQEIVRPNSINFLDPNAKNVDNNNNQTKDEDKMNIVKTMEFKKSNGFKNMNKANHKKKESKSLIFSHSQGFSKKEIGEPQIKLTPNSRYSNDENSNLEKIAKGKNPIREIISYPYKFSMRGNSDFQPINPDEKVDDNQNTHHINDELIDNNNGEEVKDDKEDKDNGIDTLIPHPDKYDQYVVNTYVLPKYLKALKKFNENDSKPKQKELQVVDFGQVITEKNTKNYLRKVDEMKKIKRQMIRNIHIKNDHQSKPFLSNKFSPHEINENLADKGKYSYAKLLSTLFNKDQFENTDVIVNHDLNNIIFKKDIGVIRIDKNDFSSTHSASKTNLEKSKDMVVKLLYPSTNREMFTCFQRIKEKAQDPEQAIIEHNVKNNDKQE